jgi:hypothetical protein
MVAVWIRSSVGSPRPAYGPSAYTFLDKSPGAQLALCDGNAYLTIGAVPVSEPAPLVTRTFPALIQVGQKTLARSKAETDWKVTAARRAARLLWRYRPGMADPLTVDPRHAEGWSWRRWSRENTAERIPPKPHVSTADHMGAAIRRQPRQRHFLPPKYRRQ